MKVSAFAVVVNGRTINGTFGFDGRIKDGGMPLYQWRSDLENRSQINCRAATALYNKEKPPRELAQTFLCLSANLLAAAGPELALGTLEFFQSGTFQYVFRYSDLIKGETKVITVPRMEKLDRSGPVSDNEFNYLRELSRDVPRFFIRPEGRRKIMVQTSEKEQLELRANVYPDLVEQGYIEITIINEEGKLIFNRNVLNYDPEQIRALKQGNDPGPMFEVFSPRLTSRFYAAVVALLVSGYNFQSFLGMDDFSIGAGDIVMRRPLCDTDPIDLKCITVRRLKNVGFYEYLDYIRQLKVGTYDGKSISSRPIADLSRPEFFGAVYRGLRERQNDHDARRVFNKYVFPVAERLFQ